MRGSWKKPLVIGVSLQRHGRIGRRENYKLTTAALIPPRFDFSFFSPFPTVSSSISFSFASSLRQQLLTPLFHPTERAHERGFCRTKSPPPPSIRWSHSFHGECNWCFSASIGCTSRFVGRWQITANDDVGEVDSSRVFNGLFDGDPPALWALWLNPQLLSLAYTKHLQQISFHLRRARVNIAWVNV